MKTNTSLSPADAGKATGKHKTTITRAIDKGELSAFRDADDRLWIEPAELFRVFPPASDAPEHEAEDATPNNTSSLHIRMLQQELQQMREASERERCDKDATIEDLRKRLDASEAERREKDSRLTALLTHEVEKAKPAAPRGLFARLRGVPVDA